MLKIKKKYDLYEHVKALNKLNKEHFSIIIPAFVHRTHPAPFVEKSVVLTIISSASSACLNSEKIRVRVGEEEFELQVMILFCICVFLFSALKRTILI